jgi:hypothetical protein
MYEPLHPAGELLLDPRAWCCAAVVGGLGNGLSERTVPVPGEASELRPLRGMCRFWDGTNLTTRRGTGRSIVTLLNRQAIGPAIQLVIPPRYARSARDRRPRAIRGQAVVFTKSSANMQFVPMQMPSG